MPTTSVCAQMELTSKMVIVKILVAKGDKYSMELLVNVRQAIIGMEPFVSFVLMVKSGTPPHDLVDVKLGFSGTEISVKNA